MTAETDLLLKSLLSAPERAPDEDFTLRMERLVLLETKLGVARRIAWTRFATEMVATAALIVAFLLLSRLAPPAADSIIPLFSPAAAGLLLLALWVAVSVRPGASLSGH